jgi:DNA-directed RNA polymerase specialized sigma24 family protein
MINKNNAIQPSPLFTKDIYDKRLLQLFLTGNSRAFDRFYNRHSSKMLHFTYRKMNYNTADAEDVHAGVWEKFLNLLLDNKTGKELFLDKIFDPDRNTTGTATPYLQTITRNRIIDFYRTKERKKEDFFEDRYEYVEVSVSKNLHESGSESSIEAIELEIYVYQAIHNPVLKIQQAIHTSYCNNEQKKLIAQKKHAEKKASVLYKIFIMRMAGHNYSDISLELGIDRKTLQKIRGEYGEILEILVVG